MKKFNKMEFIKKLISIGERQLEKETQAVELIKSVLSENNVQFVVHNFDTSIPKVLKVELNVDGEMVDCFCTSMVSGEINGNSNIVSSLISSQKFLYEKNINFNPACDGISRSNHYFAPSVAVSRKDILKISCAKNVKASMEVEKVSHKSQNILVGNINNPKVILFCHYDSLSFGATDNASGTALLMSYAIDYKELHEDVLFVIAGNEELSYDETYYWGRGYRCFENDYLQALNSSKNIFIVDCVGNGTLTDETDINVIRLGFPIKNIDNLASKMHMFYGSFDKLMGVYHSDLDKIECLDEKYLQEAEDKILEKIKANI